MRFQIAGIEAADEIRKRDARYQSGEIRVAPFRILRKTYVYVFAESHYVFAQELLRKIHQFVIG
jgi:hypothetical protein